MNRRSIGRKILELTENNHTVLRDKRGRVRVGIAQEIGLGNSREAHETITGVLFWLAEKRKVRLYRDGQRIRDLDTVNRDYVTEVRSNKKKPRRRRLRNKKKQPAPTKSYHSWGRHFFLWIAIGIKVC